MDLSDLGYIAFGVCRSSGLGHRRTPQGSALAVGRHVKKLQEKGMIWYSADALGGMVLPEKLGDREHHAFCAGKRSRT